MGMANSATTLQVLQAPDRRRLAGITQPERMDPRNACGEAASGRLGCQPMVTRTCNATDLAFFIRVSSRLFAVQLHGSGLAISVRLSAERSACSASLPEIVVVFGHAEIILPSCAVG
jgi:hypothetical protein